MIVWAGALIRWWGVVVRPASFAGGVHCGPACAALGWVVRSARGWVVRRRG